MATEHRLIPDAERHEVKGASTAINNQVLTADGDGTTSFRQPTIVGWYNYDHDGASVALTLASTYYDLINDTTGVQTNIDFALPNVDNVWNSSTNRFDWTGLDIGDTLDVRVDVVVTTTTANTAIDVVLELATDSGTPIDLPIIAQRDVKTAGTYQLTFNIPFFIGSTLVKNNPSRLKARADKTGATVAINGWYIKVAKLGDYT